MKKILTLAIALVAIVTQAASIDWKVSSTRSTYLFTDSGDKFTGMAYLVLASDVADITSVSSIEELKSNLDSEKLDVISLSNGAYASAKRRADADNSTLAPLAEFYDFQLLFVDEENQKYALSASVSEQAYTNGVDAEKLISFGASQIGAAGTAAASTTVWHPIPEPATGALALAGLALLFRRKRA